MNFKNIKKYIRTRPHKVHGFFGEDILINKIFKNKKKGFYIDIGCNHPKNGSLTYFLYKKGWNGINIDINKENIDQMKFFRKRDLSINLGVSDSKKNLYYYKFSGGSSLNTLNQKYAQSLKKKLKLNYSRETIKLITLDEIIKTYNIDSIDYLNIDVEKHENEVFKGFNLKKRKPKLITVELINKEIRELTRSRIFNLLYENNYICIAHYFRTSFFVSKSFYSESDFLNFG